jgi:hypothetical protein
MNPALSERVKILNNMTSLYSLCITAAKAGLITPEQVGKYEIKLRIQAFNELLETGLEPFAAQIMIDDQFIGLDRETGEAIL